MNEAQITVTGWVAAEPFYTITANGTPFLTVRVGCTPRRFDRRTGQWHDQDTIFLTVNCWRALADNINASEFRRGHPVVVTGRLRIRQYEKDGQWRFSAEVEATTVGHDLTRGTTAFRPAQRAAVMDADRREVRAATDQWALASVKTAAQPGDPPDDHPAERPVEPLHARPGSWLDDRLDDRLGNQSVEFSPSNGRPGDQSVESPSGHLGEQLDDQPAKASRSLVPSPPPEADSQPSLVPVEPPPVAKRPKPTPPKQGRAA